MKKKYRFFFHYRKQLKCLSIHFRGKCYQVEDILCDAPTESKWNKQQPLLVIQGFAEELIIENNIAIIK